MGRSLREKAKQQPETCSVTAGLVIIHPYLPIWLQPISPSSRRDSRFNYAPSQLSVWRGRFKFRLCRGLTTFTSFTLSFPSRVVLSVRSQTHLLPFLPFPPSLTTLPFRHTFPSLPPTPIPTPSFLYFPPKISLDPRFCDSDFETFGGVAFLLLLRTSPLTKIVEFRPARLELFRVLKVTVTLTADDGENLGEISFGVNVKCTWCNHDNPCFTGPHRGTGGGA